MSAFFIVGFILCALAVIGAISSIAGIFYSSFNGKFQRIPMFFGTFMFCVMIDAIGMLTIGGGVIDFVTTHF
jgi:hypothetical protein